MAPGQWSKLGQRLRRDLEDLVQRVAMVDFDALQNDATPEGNAYPTLVDELENAIRTTLIRGLDERGMARHGWESITSTAPEPVR